MLRTFSRGSLDAAPPALAERCRSAREAGRRLRLGAVAVLVMLAGGALTGCDSPEPIVTYTVPTNTPAELEVGAQQIAAAMVPQPGEVWFFKLLGPETAVAEARQEVRQFVQGIEFQDGSPQWDELPDGWRRGSEKPMRFATLLIPTSEKQLELSVSKLARQDDWDEQVAMNVNRWRGQVGLPPSDAEWAGAEAFEVPAADGQAVWVEMVGTAAPVQPRRPPMAAARSDSPPPVAQTSLPAAEAPSPPSEPELSFDRPEGWRDGRMSMMRMAAFNVGPEDATAEVTVIRAGGDLRGNVARWMGQLREGQRPPEEAVDQALADAQSLKVDNQPAQRFVLKGENPDRGDAIDATIVPLEGGMSLFIKMTGPVQTVTAQSDEMTSFLKSLKL